MKLLIEGTTDYEVITENTDAGKSYKIKGIFMMGETVNRNGRWYPEGVLDREAHRYVESYVKNSCAYGELDHPPTPNINLKGVSHVITGLVKEGKNWIGEAKIINTDMGRNARGLIEAGCKLGVSSRGVGNLIEQGQYKLVKDDYHLVTPADLVADPSAPKAFVQSMLEGAEWVWVEGRGWIEQFADKATKELHSTPRADLEEKQLKIFEQYLTTLRQQIL